MSILLTLSRALARAVAAVKCLWNWPATQIGIVASADYPDRPKVYQVSGKLFCGSVSQFSGYFNYLIDPQQVVLDFSRAQICDSAATQAIEQVMTRYQQLNKGVNLVGLDYQSHAVVRKSGIGIQMAGSQPLSAIAIPEASLWNTESEACELSEKV
ncbi:MAG: sodium-independent anion transporter [Cyanobacteria bacterium RM1_2_2]|nr:sodium-independent anion transporter [Cyanobacteria bacterium RM1_2_2]